MLSVFGTARAFYGFLCAAAWVGEVFARDGCLLIRLCDSKKSRNGLLTPMMKGNKRRYVTVVTVKNSRFSDFKNVIRKLILYILYI